MDGIKHIGVKLIMATAMTRQAYNDYRGWVLPAGEDGDDLGFMVEYLDGGQTNHPAHEGYISWSPHEVFERAYRPTNGMSFGLAIEAMKKGAKVARAGWNGKGMWLIRVGDFAFSERSCPEHYQSAPFIGMKTADDMFVPWLASQTDMLADDWRIVE